MGKVKRNDFIQDVQELLQRHNVKHFMLVFTRAGLTVGDGKPEEIRNALISRHCDVLWVNKAIRYVLDIVSQKAGMPLAEMEGKSKGGIILPRQ